MPKLALFCADLLLGLFLGSFNRLHHAHERLPVTAPITHSAPDNDEESIPCEYMARR